MTGVVIMVWGVGLPTLAVLVLAVWVLLVNRPQASPVVQRVPDMESATVSAYAASSLAAQN